MNPASLIFLVSCLVIVAGQLNGQGKCLDARRSGAVQQLASVAERGVEVRRLATALNEMGAACHDEARHSEADWYYLKSISLWERLPPGAGLATVVGNLAGLRLRQGRWGESEKLYRQAIGILTEQDHPEGGDLAWLYSGLAELFGYRGRHVESEQYARRALSISEQLGYAGPKRGVALFLLATARRAQGHLREAEALHRQAIASWETSLGPDHETTMSGKACLATLLSKTAPGEAEKLFREALAVYTAKLGIEHPDSRGLLKSYAGFLRGQGRKREASLFERQAVAGSAIETGGRHTVDLESLRDRSSQRTRISQESLRLESKNSPSSRSRN